MVVQNTNGDNMQFKQMPTNETDTMFKSVPKEEMNITMQEANISMSGYVSEEVKAQQVFYLYNNTNLYVTFRKKFMDKRSSRDLAVSVVMDEFHKH